VLEQPKESQHSAQAILMLVQKVLGNVCNMNGDVLVWLCALLLPEDSGNIEEIPSAQAKNVTREAAAYLFWVLLKSWKSKILA